jgi:nucleobase:cation symporter-1, NCS1 family
MFQPNPPTPKAMPDAELNAKIAELQLQPDGLVAAMALIEQQSKLRQEDALELSKWQLASQMNAATAPVSDAVEFQDPASKLEQEPVVDIFNNQEALIKEETAFVTPLEQALPPQVPVADAPASAPVSENIDDIVAALNASYAEVATEPEPAADSLNSPDPEPIASPLETITEPGIVPDPIDSPVVAAEASSEAANQSWLEEEPVDSNEAIFATTGTATAFSFSWLALAGTPLALVLAAVLKEAGASLAQSFIALASALVATSILASVGSMASARASSSLTVVSRAAFGVWGNSVPAFLMLLVKLFWAAAFVYFATRITSPLISNQPWFADVAEALIFPTDITAALFVLGPLVIISGVAAGIGGALVLRLQQLSSALSVIAIGVFVYFVASSYSLLDLDRGEPITQSSLIDLGFLLVAIFGFAIVSVSGDFARKLHPETPGAKVFFLTFISTLFLPLITGVLGLLWLFMAQDTLGSSFSAEVLATVASSAPVWVFVIFVVALGVSLVQLISAAFYSLSGSLIGLVKIPAWMSQLILVFAVLATVLIPSYLVAVSVLHESVVELLLITAVVAAAWLGIIVADALARTRGYHEVSLTREYGFYGRVNVVNTVGFVLAIALGFGYLNGGPQLSAWTGYLGSLTPEIFAIAGSNIGIAMAFGLAVIFPVLFGIPRIRKQEHNLSELDQRREELKQFLDAAS